MNRFTFLTGLCLIVARPLSAFHFESQISPECYLETHSDRYVLLFHLPEYSYEWAESEDDCGYFLDIVMDDEVGYDVLDAAGCPELPFFSYDLALPEGARFWIDLPQLWGSRDYIDGLITPAMMDEYDDDRCYEESYYKWSGGCSIYEQALEGNHQWCYYTLNEYYFGG